MKFVLTVLGVFFALALSACSQEGEVSNENNQEISQETSQENNPEINTEVLAQIDSANEIVGGDSDAHGCIGSAGYEWSELMQECMRIWEQGTPLKDVRDPEATSVAYLIDACEGAFLELFLPTGGNVMFELSEAEIWHSTTGNYMIKMDARARYSVFNPQGQMIYQSDEMFETLEPEDLVQKVRGEIGTVLSIEDGAYPMFTVEIEFKESGDKTMFSLNMEGADVDRTNFYDMVGKRVRVGYTSAEETDLAAMFHGDKAILGSKDYIPEHWIETAGVLEGADAVSNGDLPDEIYVQVTGHDRMKFEFFIPEEMVAVNGEFVTVYYVTRTRNRITKLQLAK